MDQKIRWQIPEKWAGLVPAFLILGILLFYAGVNSFWLDRDVPPSISTSQSFGYANEFADLYETIADRPFVEWPASLWRRPFPAYEPIYLLTSVVVAKLAGPSLRDVILFTNLLFLAILLVALCALGNAVVPSRGGWMSCLFLALIPAVYGTARMYYVQVAQAALVAVSLWLLVKSNGFEKRMYAALFGASVGLGMLVKFETVAFTLAPGTAVFVLGMWKERDAGRRRVLAVHFAAAAGLAALVAWPHFRNLGLGMWFRMSKELAIGDPLANVRTFTFGLAQSLLGLFFFGLAVVLVPAFFANRRVSASNKLALACGFLIPWTALLTMKTTGRLVYALPLLPALSVMLAGGLAPFPQRIRKVFLACVLAIGLVQCFDFSFAGGPGLENLTGATFSYFRPTDDVCRRPQSFAEELAVIDEGLNSAAPRLDGKRLFVWVEFFPIAFEHILTAPRWRLLDLFYKKFPVQFDVYVFQPFSFEKDLSGMDHILVWGPREFTEINTARWFRRCYDTAVNWPLLYPSSHPPQPLMSSPGEYRQKLERLEERYLNLIGDFRPRKLLSWRGESMVLYERVKERRD